MSLSFIFWRFFFLFMSCFITLFIQGIWYIPSIKSCIYEWQFSRTVVGKLCWLTFPITTTIWESPFSVGGDESKVCFKNLLALLQLFRSLQYGGEWPMFPGKVDSFLWSRHSGPRGMPQGNAVDNGAAKPWNASAVLTARHHWQWGRGELRDSCCLLCCLVFPQLTHTPPPPYLLLNLSVPLSQGESVFVASVLGFVDNVLYNPIGRMKEDKLLGRCPGFGFMAFCLCLECLLADSPGYTSVLCHWAQPKLTLLTPAGMLTVFTLPAEGNAITAWFLPLWTPQWALNCKAVSVASLSSFSFHFLGCSFRYFNAWMSQMCFFIEQGILCSNCSNFKGISHTTIPLISLYI